MKRRKSDPLRVEEFQGLYGPFAFSEKLLQKIWLLGLFETRGARLADGTAFEVLAPGRWNLLGGPDFRDARLRLGDREVSGDIEVHFHAADWVKHGHHRDPAYTNVVLHVVLFEPPAETPAPRTSDGKAIAQLVLLPWLHCNLEEFAADDAIEALTHRQGVQLAEELLELEPGPRQVRVRAAADKRWRLKLRFADLRLARLGWEEACHQTALEILGYRFNRVPMLAVAERFPLRTWRQAAPSPEALWSAGMGCWRHQGVRPANQPRRRLAQYAAWVAAVPDWPARWAEWVDTAATFVDEPAPSLVGQIRRERGFPVWREQLARQIVGGAVSGTRLDTLIADGLLPLLAARSGTRIFWRWFCWYSGDVPDWVPKALRLAGICGRGGSPLHEGAVQGALQLSLDRPAGFGAAR